MILEGSCDTEDWTRSNDAKNSALHHCLFVCLSPVFWTVLYAYVTTMNRIKCSPFYLNYFVCVAKDLAKSKTHYLNSGMHLWGLFVLQLTLSFKNTT